MCGWVKLYRDVLETELWKEVVPFRLYMLLLIQVCHEDGKRVSGIPLKKGQYIRAYSKLAGDLGYREGRGEKQYSKSTIKRAADKLVKKGLIATEELSVGTLFTLQRYEEIQASGLREFFCLPFRGTVPQQSENGSETNLQQNQEIEKVEKKKNDADRELHTEKLVAQNTGEKDTRLPAMTERFIKLRNRGTTLSAKDMNALEKVAALDLPLSKLLEWMDDIHLNNDGTINSMSYYEAAILTRIGKGRVKSKKGSESLMERMERLEKQGKLN
jgi:hypothetical protein